MTKKTKEAIKTTAVIIFVIALVLVVWVYPLNQAGKIVTRSQAPADSLIMVEPGLPYDTLEFITEDNLHLKGLLFSPMKPDTVEDHGAPVGTFVLLHGFYGDMSSQYAKAEALVQAGYQVIVYDQRAFGQSESEYWSGGYYESNDLQEVLYHLELADKLISPVVVWGEDHGGTAALRAWPDEKRIDYVIAENPVITGRDWQKRLRDHGDISAPNIMLGLVWWWMKQKSGYEIAVDETDISDAFGTALTSHPDNFLMIACGEEGRPTNEYLVELHEMGGHWLIFPCGDEPHLFDENKGPIMSAVTAMLAEGDIPPVDTK